MNKDNFISRDISKKIKLNKNFDLVISLEVAEHLPTESADIFVDTLTNHGSIIYFSAAIPLQGGTNHLNEQWQSYWANKFKERNYSALDLIRPLVWTNKMVQACYAQNGIVYVREDKLDSLKSVLKNYSIPSELEQLSIVHPGIYEDLIDPMKQTVRNEFKYFLKVLSLRIKGRMKVK